MTVERGVQMVDGVGETQRERERDSGREMYDLKKVGTVVILLYCAQAAVARNGLGSKIFSHIILIFQQ